MDDARLQADLRRYWDEFVEGGPVAPEELDPELITLIRRLHALGEVRPDATYATRLRETLMQTTAMPYPRVEPLVRPGLNGRPILPVRGPLVPLTPVSGRPQIVVHLATAALLMLLAVGSVFLFGPGRSDQHGESPAIVPAISSPPATPEPSPMAGPVAFLWETRGDPASPLGNPSHLAIAPDGSIWVADADNNRFQIFAPDGSLLEVWGTAGSGEGEFDFTTVDWAGHDQAAIAFAPDGTFYVADPGNHRIQKFGPDRGFLTAWGSEGTEPGQFDTPIDLVVDGQGRVYVLDANRVQVFDADGRFLAEWGERGFEPGQLFGPFGIGLHPGGRVPRRVGRAWLRRRAVRLRHGRGSGRRGAGVRDRLREPSRAGLRPRRAVPGCVGGARDRCGPVHLRAQRGGGRRRHRLRHRWGQAPAGVPRGRPAGCWTGDPGRDHRRGEHAERVALLVGSKNRLQNGRLGHRQRQRLPSAG